MENKTKRFLSLVFAIVMVFSMLPQITLNAQAATAYVKVTSASEFTTGNYVMVVSTGYAAGIYSSDWVTAVKTTVDEDTITDATGCVWTLTVTDSQVTIMDSNERYIAPKGSNTNGIKAGNHQWLWECTNSGTFKFTSGSVILASNKSSCNKFRAYKTSTVNGTPASYPSEFTLYKETAGGCDHTPNGEGIVTAPTCIKDGYTTYSCATCGEEYTVAGDSATGVHTPSAAATCTTAKVCTTEGCGYVFDLPSGVHNYVDAKCSTCGGEGAEGALVATFTFPNGDAGWNDGTEIKSGTGDQYTSTNGDYKLTFTGLSKVYAEARDDSGKGVIKFGTGSAAGTLQFTVAENIDTVCLHVANYKSNVGKCTVNGSAHTTTKSSNNTVYDYDVIKVDTSETKTVAIETVSGGYRMVMYAIELYEAAAPECEHKYEFSCSTKCKICGEGEREVTHTYEYDCSTTCKLCGEGEREAAHAYTYDCSTNCKYCNEATRPNVTHSYSATDGKCECGAEDPNYVAPSYVAYIGEQGYASLQEALDAAKSGDTIKVLVDATVAAGETIKLDGVKLIASEGVKLTNNGTILVSGSSDISAKVTGDGWVYMNGVTLSENTKLIGAKVGFINGTNTIVGSTIDDGWFSVGIGQDAAAATTAAFAEANGITLGDVTVNVSGNAVIGGNGKTYSGWVGSAYSADKTQHKYTLNIENSQAAFGYLHVSADGTVNVKGHTDNKYIYDGSKVDFYAGDFIINGTATFDGSDAWGMYTKISPDSATGILNIVNGANYEASIHNGGNTGNALTYYKKGAVNVEKATLYVRNITTIVADAALNITDATLTTDGTLTNNGTVTVSGESTLNIPTLSGSSSIDLLDGAIIKDSTVGGGVFVAGNVTFRGNNTFAMIYDYGTLTDYYGTTANMEWTVEEGATVKLTDKARYGLGYGDKVAINGALSDALTARENLTEDDVSFFTHGLVAQENSGWNQTSYFDVKDAYVVIGSNNSFGNKPGNYGGTYNFKVENSVLDASRITFYEASSKTNFDFVNSDVKIGTFMTRDADSEFTLTNTKLLSTATTNGTDEGNYNAGKLTLVNSSLTYNAPVTNTGKINLDATSCLAAPSITGTGTITIDATGLTGKAVKVIDLNGGEAPEVSVTNGEGVTVVTCADGDVILSNADMSAIYVDSAYTGEIGKEVAEGLYMGINAFDNINDAAAAAEKAATKLVINSASKYTTHQYYFLNTVIDAENKRFDYVADASVTYDVDANAPFTAYQILINNAELNVPVTGNLRSSEALRIMGGKIAVQGNRAENAEAPTNIFTGSWGGGVTATDDTQVSAGYLQLNQKTAATFDDTVILVTAGIFTVDDATVVLDNAYLYIGNCGTYTPAVLTVANGGKLALTNNASIVKDNSFDANMTVGADAELSLDISSKLVIDTLTVAEGGTVIIDATGIEEDKTIKVIDLNGTESLKGKVTVNNLPAGTTVVYGDDGDVTLTRATAVATIGEDRYFTLQAAVDAADDGDTITMIDNITEELVTINKAVTLNGNGYTLTGNVNLNGASLTDCTIRGQVIADGEVTLAGSNDISRLWITGDNAVTTIPEGATLTVETPYPGILIVGATETDGLAKNYFTTTSTKGGKLVVTGTLNSEAVGVFGNGELVVGGEINAPEFYTGKDATDTTSTAGKVTIAESGALQTIFCGLGGETNVAGTLTVKGAPGEHNFDAVMTVKSGAVLNVTGELVSNRGIAVEENATVNVDSGAVEFKDLNGNDSKFSGKLTNNGDINADITSSVIASSIVGDGNITIDATGLTGKATVINLSGTESLEGKVTFVGDVVATYGADGDVTIEKAVAYIGEQGYASLQAAINAAADRDTVKLLADIDLGEATLVIDKAITLDTNDHKLTAKEVQLNNAGAALVAPEGMTVTTNVSGKKIAYSNAESTYVVADIKLNASNMTLGNTLGLNFLVEVDQVKNADEVVAVLTRDDVEVKRVTLSDTENVKKVTFKVNNVDVEFYQICYDGIAAKEMNDEVTMQLFDQAGNEVSNKWTDSAVEYAKFMLARYEAGKESEELAIALVDMLNYGAAAQKAFGYNTDNLANSFLTAGQQALATQNYGKNADNVLTDAWTGGGIGYGSNLELKENIILHIWFKSAGVDKAVITYTDHYGDSKSTTVEAKDFTPRMTGVSSVAVDTLVVADGYQLVKVELHKGGEIYTVEESIESYLAYMLSKDSDNALYDATAKFITSSYNYFK